jgi:hypothetical protein
MPFQISPGVNVSEVDLTTIVPSVATTVGALVGSFRWGPADFRQLVVNEADLVNRFGKPDSNTFETFFTAANFLAYGNQLYISRAVSNTAFNAAAYVNATATSANVIIKHADNYLLQDGNFDADVQFYAKYAGALGNSLKVSVCGSSNAYSAALETGVSGNITFTTLTNSNAALIRITTTQPAAQTFNANTLVQSSNDAISIGAANSTFTIGDRVTYTVASGNTALTNLTSGTTYFITFANTTALALGLTSGGANIDLIASSTSETGHSLTLLGAINANTYANTLVSKIQVGDYILAGNTTTGSQYLKVKTIGTATSNSYWTGANTTAGWAANTNAAGVVVTLETPQTLSSTVTQTSMYRFWEYYNYVDKAPGTSTYATVQGGSGDELHVVVADEDGQFTGTPGQVIEVFRSLSRATDAKGEQGGSIYLKTYVNQTSQYIWWANQPAGLTTGLASEITPVTVGNYTSSFRNGSDSVAESSMVMGDLSRSADLFRNSEDVDISLFLTGKNFLGVSGEGFANYIIDNVCEYRKDCMAFVSPMSTNVVNNPGSELTAVTNFAANLRPSSFAVMDSGYKYQYDKYNDVYRWVPLNGDIAGTMVITDQVRDPWYSPAGFNRGNIKNVVKLAWNPDKGTRDQLYKLYINPVVNFPGRGTVLYGDKTFLGRPSAFDRINVRRLFIVLEKAISTAATSTLFELNDDFTRAQFRNLVEPYLRDIQARRGIYDYRVVCDSTNNTAERVDRNEFWGDIYIKPARAVNFIQLNFVAVRSGVNFDEIVGTF